MMPRIVTTPLDAPRRAPRELAPRAVAPDVLDAVLPGPGRDRLAQGDVLVVTTGQQPGLFTGPLYTIHKALSAAALAARLERERGRPVVPVFWVAGDDHDFAEANHATILDAAGDALTIVLRERAADARQVPLFRESCGADAAAALETLRARTAESEFKAQVLDWLGRAYGPETSLADAGAEALNALLAPRGVAVFRAWTPAAKRAGAPRLLRALDVTLPDGLSPVLVEGAAGRDRLRPDGGAWVARRSGERFTRDDLARIAADAPERLSANVLLRPALEAALFPTLAYVAGPGELQYFPDAAPCFAALDVAPQPAVPRWSGLILEGRVERLLERHGLTPDDFRPPPGALEARLVRDQLPPEAGAALAELVAALGAGYTRLERAAGAVDATLARTVQNARNSALVGVQEIERKLVASLKRANDGLVHQLARARAALFPAGVPQERAITAPSFFLRYGFGLVDAIAAEVARWTDGS